MQVFGLNAKIAELESEMHDVVRELVRTNLDVQNIKVILSPASTNPDVALFPVQIVSMLTFLCRASAVGPSTSEGDCSHCPAAEPREPKDG